MIFKDFSLIIFILKLNSPFLFILWDKLYALKIIQDLYKKINSSRSQLYTLHKILLRIQKNINLMQVKNQIFDQRLVLNSKDLKNNINKIAIMKIKINQGQ